VPNFNDAEITDIFVSQQASAGVQDDAPNAQNPGGPFDATLEMVAGWGLGSGAYTLYPSCVDLTDMVPAPLLIPAAWQAADTFGSANWQPVPGKYYTYSHDDTVSIPAGTKPGHVYQYTVTLVSGNGQVVSIKQSDPFILV
jgi:hypothetical protein